MKTVLVTLAPGFKRNRNYYGCRYFKKRRGQSDIDHHSSSKYREGSRDIKILPDAMIEVIMDKEFDLIFLHGGRQHKK
jgi:hypothetical protein